MRCYVTLLFITLTVLVARSAPAGGAAADRAPEHAAQANDNTTYLDLADLFMFATNTGTFGRDLEDMFGYGYGTFFPSRGLDSISSGADSTSPLFVAGLWMTGVDAVTGDTLAAIGEYATEYVPGPMSGGTFQTDNPSFRVYKLHADSLVDNPNADYAEWPVDQGAPTDRHGAPLLFGEQHLWSVCNDADPNQHIGNPDAGETDPIGIEVRRSIWGEGNTDDWNQGEVYVMYTIHNRRTSALNGVYISFWADPDIGDREDDLMGCDTVRQAMYCYNGNPADAIYGEDPPAIGFEMLAGPVVPDSATIARVGPYVRAGYRNLPVTSFNSYSNGEDPDDFRETYNFQHGLKKTGQPHSYNGDELTHRFTGNPMFGIGDIDTLPGDRRVMASYGPLTMQPGDSQHVFLRMTVTEPHGFFFTGLESLFDQFDQPSFWPGWFSSGSAATVQPPLFDQPIEILIWNLSDGDSVDAIRPGSIAFRGQGSPIVPDSVVVLDSLAGFSEPSLLLYFDRQAVFDQYSGNALEIEAPYSLSFNTDRLGFVANGELTIQRALMGDVSHDGLLNLSDITQLVNHVFLDGPAPAEPAAADLACDGEGRLTITDLTLLVNYLYLDGASPRVCDYWLQP